MSQSSLVCVVRYFSLTLTQGGDNLGGSRKKMTRDLYFLNTR